MKINVKPNNKIKYAITYETLQKYFRIVLIMDENIKI